MSRKLKTPLNTPPYRVLLIEDHAIVREGLAAILSTYPTEFTVCAQAATSRAARELAAEHQPHLIILDYFLGDGDDGGRLLTDLALLCPQARRLVLSLSNEDDLAERAIRAGAHGYLVKTQGTERLLIACRAVLNGGFYVSPELQARLLDQIGSPLQPPASPYTNLTDRELQIFNLLGASLSLEVIAERLGVSPKTIASHRENLKNKLGHDTASGLADAARKWLQQSRV
jgi:DNA-binding NarL/FixJ family response regulator